ncbi:MAG: Coenzyme F420 hydrogenase/dehydrogenase, beta subunit C-terminal domain [Pseudomonadota bacterium]
MARQADSIAEVVASGLCIGCGLCEALSGGRATMTMTDYGALRPNPVDTFTASEEAELLAVCPGVRVEPRQEAASAVDAIWGGVLDMRYAWSGDADVRHRGATAGVLTTLGQHLLATGRVEFVAHVGSNPANPAFNHAVISESGEAMLSRAGSRYAPVSPLTNFIRALDRNKPFALIAKPCDLNAVHRLSKRDQRVDELCVARLAMVCGGQSRHTKTRGLLNHFGVSESDVRLLRYRGFGNPGLTHVETHQGDTHQRTYLEEWGDESSWELETRCKLCPDALGEAADLVVADVWPGGAPTGEDAGFSGIIVRTQAGQALVDETVAAGQIILGEPISPRQFDDFQPHQRRKKLALAARFDGLTDAGLPTIDARDLRLTELGYRCDSDEYQRERQGTAQRARDGRIAEPAPFSASRRSVTN